MNNSYKEIKIETLRDYVILLTGLLLETDIDQIKNLVSELSEKYILKTIRLMKSEKVIQKTKNHKTIRLTKTKGVEELKKLNNEIYLHYMWLTENHEKLNAKKKLFGILNYLVSEGFAINFIKLKMLEGRWNLKEKEQSFFESNQDELSIFKNLEDRVVRDYQYILRNISLSERHFFPAVIFTEMNRAKIYSNKVNTSRIRQSRAIGVIFSEGNVFPCYHVGIRTKKWLGAIEKEFSLGIGCSLIETNQKVDSEVASNNRINNAILFYESDEDLKAIVKYRKRYLETYRDLFLVQLEGERENFEIISKASWRKVLFNELYGIEFKSRGEVYGADLVTEDEKLMYELLTMNLKKLDNIKYAVKENAQVIIVLLESKKEQILNLFSDDELSKIELMPLNLEDIEEIINK